MVAGNTEETALGSARGRFFEGLPRKAMELSAAVSDLEASPAAEAPRDDMLRRLNALYASALLFRNQALALALQDCIEVLDEAREQRRPLSSAELERLALVVHRLPELRDDPDNGELLSAPLPLAGFAAAEQRAITARSEALFTSATAHGGWEEEPGSIAHPAASIAQREGSRAPLLQRVLDVCLLAPRRERESIVALLSGESLRLSVLEDVDQLLALAREDAPDVVLANEQLAYESDLAARLRNEAKSDFTPIVLYQSAESAAYPFAEGDARVRYPFRGEQLLETLGVATGTLIAATGPARLGELTVSELAERVARDLRRGLVDQAVEGRTRRVAIADETEVLSVVYNAIAELRAAIVRDSGGEVRFAARPADRGPAVIVGGRASESDVRLLGRRVLLVEDDTAVVLLLANQLREQGATVHELTDGRDALAAALRERPDLVIAGSRVAGLDAFELTRSFAREPLLADVPLLLLPPKDKLLNRAKDSGVVQLSPLHAEQVVASAAALLHPRSELEDRLRQAGDVRGSLEGTGVIALLRSVRRTRPDARVCIRDAWNLFECELRDGRLAQVTRTACDGSFVRNDRALPQLLGTRAGRFSVVPAESAMKAAFEGTLDEVLTRGARALAAELDAVSGARFARVARVVFDEDAYTLLVSQTPERVRKLLERLHAGDSPSEVASDERDRDELIEPLLLDLVRRGGLRAVVGVDGEDLIAESARERANEQPTELASPLSLVPPPPNPVISVLAADPRRDPERAQAERVERGERTAAQEPTAKAAAEAAASVEVSVALGAARARESSISDASEIAAAAAEARRSKSTLAAWTVALLALGAVAFFVAREPEGGIMPVEAIGSPRPAEPVSAATPVREGVARGDGFTIYDEILASDVSPAEDEALLMIEAAFPADGVRVWLDGRELPKPPLNLALSPGDHEVAVQRGDAVSYRYLTAQPGKTWVLKEP